MKKADDYVKENILTDPVLGNPEIGAENIGYDFVELWVREYD